VRSVGIGRIETGGGVGAANRGAPSSERSSRLDLHLLGEEEEAGEPRPQRIQPSMPMPVEPTQRPNSCPQPSVPTHVPSHPSISRNKASVRVPTRNPRRHCRILIRHIHVTSIRLAELACTTWQIRPIHTTHYTPRRFLSLRFCPPPASHITHHVPSIHRLPFRHFAPRSALIVMIRSAHAKRRPTHETRPDPTRPELSVTHTYCSMHRVVG
jgi:hypothetical protein